MRVDMLANFLAENGVGRVGTTIFAHSMPAECDEGVLIKLPLDGISINQYIPGYYQTEIDLIVRAQGQEKGQALADKIQGLLTLHGREFRDPRTKKVVMTIKQMLPLYLPIRFPRSDGNGIEFAMCFHTSYTM